jgi:peptidoglycan/LPS O-acetylase OafA/YrhL
MQRLVCLDGLRGVLAFYVMLSHTLPFAPMPPWLVRLFSHGGAGVDVFFILSGMVIVQSLASFGYRPRPFLIARVARIYPVFLVVFTAAVALQPVVTAFPLMPWIASDGAARVIWSGGWPSDWFVGIATHLTMTHGLIPDGVLPHVWVAFLGVAWSLSTEWQFYLLALLIGARLGLFRLVWLLLAVSAASIAWHAVAPDAWHFSRAFLPNRAQYFALGIASAIVAREGVKGLGALVMLAATLVLCVVQGGPDKLLPPLVWTLCLAAQLLGCEQGSSAHSKPGVARDNRYVLAICLQGLRLLASMLQSRPLVWLGAVSYCIYLVHEPLQRLLGLLVAMVVQGDAVLFTALWFPGAVALPLLAAWWLHEWVETPALRWGRSLARRGIPVAAPVTVG